MLTFISSNRELRASLSRYYKFIHERRLNTASFNDEALFAHDSRFTGILIIQNEISVNGEVCGIFPAWFAWGKQNNKINMYAFSYEETNLKNKILDWGNILNEKFYDKPERAITSRDFSHYESTEFIIKEILKPHCGYSLFDLSAKLYSSFVGLIRKIKRKDITESLLITIKEIFLDKGEQFFLEFLEKEKKHHQFLSFLPGSPQLFEKIESLRDSIESINQVDFGLNMDADRLIALLGKTEIEVRYIYHFFEILEQNQKGVNS